MWKLLLRLVNWGSNFDDDPTFLSLGMVVIDELRFPNNETLFDVPGGSGLYATLGARLLSCTGLSQPTSTACIVQAGDDFPRAVLHKLQGWQLRLRVLKMHGHATTRGLLVYEDDAFGKKSFVYTTPPLQPRPSHLEDTSLLRAKSFHILALPGDLETHISELLDLRKKHGINNRPLIVWEPAPPGCNQANLQAHLQACKLVDVFSPNHLELGYLVEGRTTQHSFFDKAHIEVMAKQFLDAVTVQKGCGLAVIRSGEFGVLTLSSSGAEWLPPYFDEPSPKVVDPTGAGNAFLGGFTAMLCATGDSHEATLCGSVTASFALEQFGVPKLTTEAGGIGELWNGTSVKARVDEFRARIAQKTVQE